MTQASLDPQIVGQIKALGGEKLLADLIDLFLEHTPERLEEVRRGVLKDDLKRAEKALHSFRSSSVSLGARSEAEEAADLERLARAGKSAALRAKMADFEASVSRLLAGLRTQQEELRS